MERPTLAENSTLRTSATRTNLLSMALNDGEAATAAPTADPPADHDRIADDPNAVIALAQQAFHKAANAAVAENDRLGIPTHGAVGGKLVIRQPPTLQALDEI